MTDNGAASGTTLISVPFQVRWSECDPAGIIYHPRVLDWFSEGRLAWLEANGSGYYEVLRARGVDLVVLTCEARFHHMLRPGNTVSLEVRGHSLTPTRLQFSYTVRAAGRLAVDGVTRHVFVAEGHAINLKKRHPTVYAGLWNAQEEDEGVER